MRRLLLILISVLLHAYVALRLMPSLAGWPAAASVFGVLLAASALLLPLSLIGRNLRWPGGRAALAWSGMLAMGLFSSLLVLTLLRDVLLLTSSAFAALWPGVLPVEDIGLATAWAVLAAAAMATVLGAWNARRTAAVVRVDVPVPGLPAALHGFTIAQISDIHVGPTIRGGYLQAIVDRVNRLEADMVAVTGDLVDGSVAELAPHVEPLAALRSRHGTFFVTGNHEYYSGAHAWIAELRRLDVRVLLNEHVVLRHEGSDVVVAGVTDHGAHHFDIGHRSDPRASVLGAPLGAALRLLLAHQPRSALAAVGLGFHLQLSGHTHGGQFWPWNLFVRLQQPFTAGLHRLQDLRIYISRGTGYWGPPKRFGAPSEITHLRMVQA
jgi:predicted MPP superfamily phosphohydrolase